MHTARIEIIEVSPGGSQSGFKKIANGECDILLEGWGDKRKQQIDEALAAREWVGGDQVPSVVNAGSLEPWVISGYTGCSGGSPGISRTSL